MNEQASDLNLPGPDNLCEQSAAVDAYHDGELSPERREAVEAHLTQCPACRALLADLRSLSRLLVGAAAPSPASAPPELMTARALVAFRRARQRDLLRMASALTAAAAVLLGVLLLRPVAPVRTMPPAPPPAVWDAELAINPAAEPYGEDAELVQLAQWMADDLARSGSGSGSGGGGAMR